MPSVPGCVADCPPTGADGTGVTSVSPACHTRSLSVPFASILPLYVSAAFLLAGNGLLGTLAALRASAEGFGDTVIGLVGAAYFLGFLLGVVYTARLIRLAGHIRVFAAFAALSAAASIVLVLMIDPWVWAASRFVMGIAFCGLAMVIESWLNDQVPNGRRGRVLAVYRILDLVVVTAVQFLLPVVGTDGFTLFALVAVMMCLAVVPVSLSGQPGPRPPANADFDPKFLWRLSPVAAIGCFTIGLTNAAFRTNGPLFANASGFDIGEVAVFMSLGIIGGAVLQYPLGWLSDVAGRRSTLIATTGGAVGAGVLLSATAGEAVALAFVGSFLFGGFALPLYSLSAAHANDFAKPGQFVDVAAGITLFYALGAIIGPLVSAIALDLYGPPAFFGYTAVVHSAFIVFVLYRMTRRAERPVERRSRFVALLRTSPALMTLARSAMRRGRPGRSGDRKDR